MVCNYWCYIGWNCWSALKYASMKRLAVPNGVRLRNKVYMFDNMKTAVMLRTKVYIPAILLYHINFVLIYHLNFIYNLCISSVGLFSLYIIIMRKKHMMKQLKI